MITKHNKWTMYMILKYYVSFQDPIMPDDPPYDK